MNPIVLVLVKGLGLGGAEKLIVAASEHWPRSQFSFHVAYMLPWKDQLVGELEARGVPVTCIGRFGVRTPSRLRRLIRQTGASLVHAHSPSAAILARAISPVPVVYTEHNLADSYHAVTRVLNKATYRRNAAVIAVSDAVAHSLARYPGSRPRTIANGVAVSVSPDARERIRREFGTPLVVHVANIRPGKGHETLIEAAKQLPRGVRVVSIGVERKPGDLDRLRRIAGDAVALLGRRADAAEFIAAADVFVIASTHEGLPVSLLEAFALGTPVVATAVGGIPGVIRDGETGLLVEPHAIASAVARLLADPVLASRIAASARELIEREYGVAGMVSRTLSVYEDVLTASPTAPMT